MGTNYAIKHSVKWFKIQEGDTVYMKSIFAEKSFQPAQFAFFSTLFLISGAAGLIYEIIWERLLETYFGVTMTSITLIVSAYMAGLGLGSLFGGELRIN